MNVDYRTIFEIGVRSFPWVGLLHPTIFIALGLLLFRFSGGKETLRVFGAIAACFAALFFVILALVLVPEFVKQWRAYANGKSVVLEGTVEEFHPMPSLGPANESFSVQGVQFSYNVLDSTPCFHDAPPRKGPIRQGLNVRIYYTDACIQRVDVRP